MRISDWSSDVCSSDLRRQDEHVDGRRELVLALQLQVRAELREGQQRAPGTERRPEHRRGARAVLLVAGRGSRTLGTFPDLRTIFSSKRSEETTSELQSIRPIPYAVFCCKKKNY